MKEQSGWLPRWSAGEGWAAKPRVRWTDRRYAMRANAERGLTQLRRHGWDAFLTRDGQTVIGTREEETE